MGGFKGGWRGLVLRGRRVCSLPPLRTWDENSPQTALSPFHSFPPQQKNTKGTSGRSWTMGATPCAGSWWTSLARSTLPSLVGVHVGGCVCWWCSGVCESCCCREACTEEIALGRPAGRMGHTSGRVECQSACHRMKVRSGTYPCVCMMPHCSLSPSPTPPQGRRRKRGTGTTTTPRRAFSTS